MTMIDHELSAAHAAQWLANELKDGRDYGLLLADQRRGRRREWTPYHTGKGGRVFYYLSNLRALADAERKRSLSEKPIRKVERDEFSALPPTKILGFV